MKNWLKKHWPFLGLCAAGLVIFIWAMMSLPGSANAQSFVNPNRPVPYTRYPICDPLDTGRGVQNCTANRNLAQSRADCGWNCPEDQPRVYDRLGAGTLRLFCGDENGVGCLDAFFTREYEPRGAKCIYRVVSDDTWVSPDEERFVIRVSRLRYEGRIDLVKRTDGSHARYNRRYNRQMQDQARFTAPPPPGHYRPYRNPCRH